MNPNKIDLETPYEYYIKLKDRMNLTPGEAKQLIKYVDEVKFIVQSAKLGPQGHKSAVYIFNCLSKLENKHRIKKLVKQSEGLFSNAKH